ncbi:MAG TPA: GNAT family N-acetyltransferase [Dehalococcoidia bacterium]|nr:GNAT family N-acetyltransferase [Dehalococcoidia bacterium]
MAPLLRLARHDESDVISSLIQSANFPPIEVEEWIDSFWVIENDGRIAGCAGVERYGDTAVLRSVVIAPSLRGTGQGVVMTEAALDWARENGATTCLLFTFDAVDFFRRFGFERCSFDEYDEEAREGWQYRGAMENEELRTMLIPMRLLL